LAQGRPNEAIAESERALTDPANVFAYSSLSWDYLYLGQFERSLEFSDKAIRLSRTIQIWMLGMLRRRPPISD
jgi:hypothetical protein